MSDIDCIGGINGDRPTELCSFDIERAVERLTCGLENKKLAIFGLIHPDLRPVLSSALGYVPWFHYSHGSTCEYEIGAMGEMRFIIDIESQIDLLSSANREDVYRIHCVAMNFYGKKYEKFIKNPVVTDKMTSFIFRSTMY